MSVDIFGLFNNVLSFFNYGILHEREKKIDPEIFYDFFRCSRTDEVKVILTFLRDGRKKLTFNFLDDDEISISLVYFGALNSLVLDIGGIYFTSKDIPRLKFDYYGVPKHLFSFIHGSYHNIYESVCMCKEISDTWTIGENYLKFYGLIDHYRESFDLDVTNFGDQDLMMYALFHYFHDYKDLDFTMGYDFSEFIRYFILNHISDYNYIYSTNWESLIEDEDTIENLIKSTVEFKAGLLLLRDNIVDKYSLDDATMISMSDFIYRPLKLGNIVKDTFVNFLYNHFKESIKLRLKDE